MLKDQPTAISQTPSFPYILILFFFLDDFHYEVDNEFMGLLRPKEIINGIGVASRHHC